METNSKHPAPGTIVPTMKAPKVLLEIFAYGLEEDKEGAKTTLQKLQNQINPYSGAVAVLWYFDKGEKTNSQKLDWYMETGNAKFYMAINVTSKTI